MHFLSIMAQKISYYRSSKKVNSRIIVWLAPSGNLLQKLIAAQLVYTFLSFYGSRMIRRPQALKCHVKFMLMLSFHLRQGLSTVSSLQVDRLEVYLPCTPHPFLSDRRMSARFRIHKSYSKEFFFRTPGIKLCQFPRRR